MSRELNPGIRASTARTATVVRTDPRTTSPRVQTRVNDGKTDYDALMFMLEKRYSNNYQFRVSYTWSKQPRQHQRQRRAREQLPVPGRHEPRPERGADGLRPHAQLRVQRRGGDPQDRRRDLLDGRALPERDDLHGPGHHRSTTTATASCSSRCRPARTRATAPTRSPSRARAAATARAGRASSRRTSGSATASSSAACARSSCSARCFNVTNRGQLREPDRRPLLDQLPEAHGAARRAASRARSSSARASRSRNSSSIVRTASAPPASRPFVF